MPRFRRGGFRNRPARRGSFSAPRRGQAGRLSSGPRGRFGSKRRRAVGKRGGFKGRGRGPRTYSAQPLRIGVRF